MNLQNMLFKVLAYNCSEINCFSSFRCLSLDKSMIKFGNAHNNFFAYLEVTNLPGVNKHCNFCNSS